MHVVGDDDTRHGMHYHACSHSSRPFELAGAFTVWDGRLATWCMQSCTRPQTRQTVRFMVTLTHAPCKLPGVIEWTNRTRQLAGQTGDAVLCLRFATVFWTERNTNTPHCRSSITTVLSRCLRRRQRQCGRRDLRRYLPPSLLPLPPFHPASHLHK